jgi:hypothetical protein
VSPPSDDRSATVCPSCAGTGEDGAFHPCLQCHGDGFICVAPGDQQSARGELAGALEQARVALAGFNDAELAIALSRIAELSARLELPERPSAGEDG